MKKLSLFMLCFILFVSEAAAEKARIRVNISPKKPETADVTGPVITIIHPEVQRGIVRNKGKTLRVEGTVTDESGIFEVLVNGESAAVSKDGKFRADVKLAYGANTFEVKATDIKDNTSQAQFTVVRESDELGSSSEPDTQKQTIPDAGVYHALLIAVQDYTHPSVTKLSYPIRDAERLFTVLTSYYSFDEKNIRFLKNPDRKQIIRELENLEKLTPSDNLLIFYAGHGYWDEKKKQGYWLPINAVEGDTSDWISNSTVRDHINGIKTRHTLLISDACFSGSIFQARDPFLSDKAMEEIYKKPSRRAITSGAMKQVPDKSPFIHYFSEYLKNNSKPALDAQKLFVEIREPVINNSPNRQTPLYGVIQETDDQGGDFIFIRKNK